MFLERDKTVMCWKDSEWGTCVYGTLKKCPQHKEKPLYLQLFNLFHISLSLNNLSPVSVFNLISKSCNGSKFPVHFTWIPLGSFWHASFLTHVISLRVTLIWAENATFSFHSLSLNTLADLCLFLYTCQIEVATQGAWAHTFKLVCVELEEKKKPQGRVP